MKYKVGDKVRLKVMSRYSPELISAIRKLPGRTVTIREIRKIRKPYSSYKCNPEYLMEEIPLIWTDNDISYLIKPYIEEVSESINSRFEILDL